MKRILSALVVMAMLLACLGTALAETWYCPNCGSRCDSNFCPSCGTRKPSSGSNAAKRNPVNTFELQVLWPQLSHSRLYVAKLALKTPLGYTSGTRLWDPFKLDRYTAGIAYTYSMSTDWLERIQSDFGYIPTGTYTFEFYLNGQLYDYVSVPVRN